MRAYGVTDDPAEADMILLNTCHIREKAAEKVYSELGTVPKAVNGGPPRKPGSRSRWRDCVAQAEGGEILARAPMVGLVAGPQAIIGFRPLNGPSQGGAKVID